jgi:hypothetical protein
MSGKFIEVTRVTVVGGGAMSPTKRMIGVDHIVSIVGGGSHDTSVIVLANNEKLNVTETYDELKALVGT